jgi:hypothetical protein
MRTTGRTVQADYLRIDGNFSLRLGVKIWEAIVNTDGKQILFFGAGKAVFRVE